MSIAETLNQYLEKRQIPYSEIPHGVAQTTDQLLQLVDIPADHLLVATPIIDRQGIMFVIHASNAELDVAKLNQALHRTFQLLSARQSERLFKDCEEGAAPALANAYGLPVVVDTHVLGLSRVWMRSGSQTSMIHFAKTAAQKLLHGLQSHDCVRWNVAREPVLQSLELDTKPLKTLEDVARRLQSVYSLPPMPAIAVNILHLVTNPASQVGDLVRVIEQDPSLAAQILRYARSALFNFPGKIESVKDAVTIVLGFERVANIAMGLAAKRAFVLPANGPLGLNNFWRHSLYNAFLCQQISLQMPGNKGVLPGTAYLAGLLHNFGILLMGQIFTPEYKMLSGLIAQHPETPVSVLERQVFGMGWAQDVISLGHGTIGGILLKLWNLPEAAVKAAALHQVPGYVGEYETYVHLVQVSNLLLHEAGIGEHDTYGDVDVLFSSLGFSGEQGREIVAEALKYSAELDILADELAA
jgi:HD-like signal output (HDOD) protein/prolyl-tRNA editing enzyme YbaK/EbsC (Cys-tRNA(Pro) deacylase)